MLHCRSLAGAWRTFVLCIQILRYSRKYTRISHPGKTQGMRQEYYPLRTICHAFQLVVSVAVEFWTVWWHTYATPLPLILSIGPQWEPLTWRIQQCQLLDMYPIRVHRPINWQWTTSDTLFGESHVCDMLHTADRPKKYSAVCYNERCYNERMLRRTVFIHKMRMLQRTQMLKAEEYYRPT